MASNQKRKVRVIAKIKGSGVRESESGNGAPWIKVHKPEGDQSESVSISFRDQASSRRETFQVDYCYDQNENNDLIFSREVKPLISGVFGGCNASVVACGGRDSGKTYLIQGSDEDPGLAVLGMAEILSIADESGKSIAISFYEVFQDHVFDLLDAKRPEVTVLEAQGRIQLKGISQVFVKSIEEFQKLYLNLRKPVQKIPTEPLRRSHKGLIVQVFSKSEKSDNCPVGKMNFVDLAGYEDSRRKSSEGLNHADNTKINRSIYSFQNVIHALNSNENHVPYRETKLTHMLKDSLGGINKILMVTCVNPSFWQDSIYMVKLASRSCQCSNSVVLESTKKTKSSTRPVVHSSQKSWIPGSASATVQKKTIPPPMHFSGRKTNGMASGIKGRKLFSHTNNDNKLEKTFEKESSLADNMSATQLPAQEEEKLTSNVQASDPLKLDDSLTAVFHDSDSISTVLQEPPLLEDVEAQGRTMPHEDNHEGDATFTNNNTKAISSGEEGQNIDKENSSSYINEGVCVSPPISVRLQELSNSLKLLYSSKPSCKDVPTRSDVSSNSQASYDVVEPKTPEHNMRVDGRWETPNINCSPWETFTMRSSGVKHSLVQEYLKLVNTASKDDLKKLKGIGEKRATYILQLREQSPEPFKSLDDLKDIGLSAKQIKGFMKKEFGEIFP